MKSISSRQVLTTLVTGLLLFFAAQTCLAQTFTLNLPSRGGTLPDGTTPKLPIARVKITLDVANAPVTGAAGDSLAVPGGTIPLDDGDPIPLPDSIGGNRVRFYKGVGNTIVIDIRLDSRTTNPAGGSLCVPKTDVPLPPPTMDLTITFAAPNTVTGHRLNSYSALSAFQCNLVKRRVNDPGATWMTPPDGIPHFRHALDVVLVLDRSGSMDDPVPSRLLPPGSIPDVKMDVLKEAVKQFIGLWNAEATGQPDDRLAIVWFESGISSSPAGFTFVTRASGDWIAAGTGLQDLVDGQTTGGSTAMGDGFSKAVDMLEDDLRNDGSIVLLTNGMQNSGNKIKPDLVDAALMAFNHLNAPPPGGGYLPIKEVGIPVQTVGVGAADGTVLTSLLNQISQQSGGESNIVVDDADMADTFGNHLVSILKGNTMSLLKRTSGVLSGGSSAVSPPTTISVDGTIRQAIVVLGWSRSGGANALRLEISKPGGGAPVGIQKDLDSFYTIQTVELPASGPPGDWQVGIVRNAGSAAVPFYMSVYTVESTFTSRIDFKKPEYGTGEDIILTAALGFNGQPLLNQNTGIQVRIDRPQSAVGTALHNLLVPANVLTTQPAGVNADSYTTPYERKLFHLLQTTQLGQDIRPQTDPTTFTLLDNGNPDNGDSVAGDGIYSMRYSETNTRVPGRYRFNVNLNVTTPTSLQIRRAEQHDTEVNVLKFDLDETEVAATRDLVTGNFRVDIVPADRFGNFLGPGFEQDLRIFTVGGGTTAGPVLDERQNGTYTATVTGVAPGTNPTLKATFRGVEFVSVLLNDTKPNKRWAVFGGLGANIPHGTFNTFFDPGVSTQLGFEYRFTNRISAEGTFGYDRFNFAFGPGNQGLFRASGNLKGYAVLGTYQLGFFGGGGVYHFTSGGPTRGGVNFGVVNEYRINTSWSVEGTYNFHNVFLSGNQFRFSTVQGGVRYRF